MYQLFFAAIPLASYSKGLELCVIVEFINKVKDYICKSQRCGNSHVKKRNIKNRFKVTKHDELLIQQILRGTSTMKKNDSSLNQMLQVCWGAFLPTLRKSLIELSWVIFGDVIIAGLVSFQLQGMRTQMRMHMCVATNESIRLGYSNSMPCRLYL